MWKLIRLPIAGRYWANVTPFTKKHELFNSSKHLELLDSITEEPEYDLMYGGTVLRIKTHLDKDNSLPNGVYQSVDLPSYGYFLKEHSLPTDELLTNLELTSSIRNDFNTFKNSRQIYDELKITYKRGILLYGPPGTGKSCLINKIASEIVDTDQIIIFVTGALTSQIIDGLRTSRKLNILIFEEFTNYLNSDGTASAVILSLLDGDSSIPNTFIIASTNYPEQLPLNIVNRPGRFDKFYFLGHLNQKDIKKYASRFNVELTKKELHLLDNVTIAVLKEILLRSKLNKQSIEEVIKEIDKQKVFIKEKTMSDTSLDKYIL